MVHGGFWRAKYDLNHASHLCASLARAGMASFNLEYRRVGNPGGGWPGTFEDIRNGFRFIEQYARAHGIPARVVVIGHSAGGQLALCLAAREPSLQGVVSLAGVVDLQRAWELHLSNDAVVDFMGGTPARVPEHFREASPMELSIPHARQVLIHGTDDDVVPIDFSRRYANAKKQRHEKVRLVEIPSAGHFEPIDPESKAWSTVLSVILELA
jgi:acetyl esterase/lipase